MQKPCNIDWRIFINISDHQIQNDIRLIGQVPKILHILQHKAHVIRPLKLMKKLVLSMWLLIRHIQTRHTQRVWYWFNKEVQKTLVGLYIYFPRCFPIADSVGVHNTINLWAAFCICAARVLASNTWNLFEAHRKKSVIVNLAMSYTIVHFWPLFLHSCIICFCPC